MHDQSGGGCWGILDACCVQVSCPAIFTIRRCGIGFISCGICRAKSRLNAPGQACCTSRAQVLREKTWFLRGLQGNTLPGYPRGMIFQMEEVGFRM